MVDSTFFSRGRRTNKRLHRVKNSYVGKYYNWMSVFIWMVLRAYIAVIREIKKRGGRQNSEIKVYIFIFILQIVLLTKHVLTSSDNDKQ